MLMSFWVTELISQETLFSAKVIPIKLFSNHSPFQNSRIGRGVCTSGHVLSSSTKIPPQYARTGYIKEFK